MGTVGLKPAGLDEHEAQSSSCANTKRFQMMILMDLEMWRSKRWPGQVFGVEADSVSKYLPLHALFAKPHCRSLHGTDNMVSSWLLLEIRFFIPFAMFQEDRRLILYQAHSMWKKKKRFYLGSWHWIYLNAIWWTHFCEWLFFRANVVGCNRQQL